MILQILKYVFVALCLSINLYSQEPVSSQETFPVPVFELPDTNHSNSGTLKLIWTLPENTGGIENYTYELQQSKSRVFDSVRTRYRGPDLASYISGLKDGNYFYRVRALRQDESGAWSDPLLVSVRHHSLKLAFLLFGLGAIVFLSTVFVVVRGTKDGIPVQTREQTGEGGE